MVALWTLKHKQEELRCPYAFRRLVRRSGMCSSLLQLAAMRMGKLSPDTPGVHLLNKKYENQGKHLMKK